MHLHIDSGEEMKKLGGTRLMKRFDIFHIHSKVRLRETQFLFYLLNILFFPNHH